MLEQTLGPSTHLIVRGCSNSYQETSTSNRSDDFACTVGAENQPHIVHVLLHRSSQSCLRISR